MFFVGAVVELLSEYCFVSILVITNNGKSCGCLATLVIQVIVSWPSYYGILQLPKNKKACSFCKMCVSPWYYIRSQVIEENVSFLS
jgi:hypothetical protein